MSSTPHDICEIHHGVGRSSSSFVLIASTPLCEYIQLIHSTANGFLSCFLFGPLRVVLLVSCLTFGEHIMHFY